MIYWFLWVIALSHLINHPFSSCELELADAGFLWHLQPSVNVWELLLINKLKVKGVDIGLGSCGSDSVLLVKYFQVELKMLQDYIR